MVWKKVESSNINSVRLYEGDLYVEFKAGAKYKYYCVTVEKYNELLESDSVGRFVNKHIKGQHIVEKL